MGRSILPFEQFYTLVVEAESVMNSRPLRPVRSSDSDFKIIRPIDFISPEVELNFPCSDPLDECDYSISAKERLIQWHNSNILCLEYFWKLWHTDYLQAVADRNQKRLRQGRSTPCEIAINDVVIIADESLSRNQWPLGIVIATKLSEDGTIRSAAVRREIH